ncbi:MAG: hypothetical protein Q9165_002493 [Trypethelium subeluteriae]
MSQRETFKGPVCGIDNCTATRYVEDEEGELQRRELEDEEFIQATGQTRARRQKEARERILRNPDDEDEEGGSQSQVYTSTATSEAKSREKCDIQGWAASGILPYNRVITAIPEAMRLPLSTFYLQILELQFTLQPGDVQAIASSMGMVYQQEIKMELPPVNMPLLLYRYIKELSLPLDIYPCVRNLAQIVPYTFSYSSSSRRLYEVPDVQIMSLIIVAAKLLYPISNPRFHPATAGEPASLSLNWKAWLSAKRAHDAKFVHSGRLNFADAFAASDADVFTWRDEQMDDYLTWYEQTWTRAEPPADNDFRRALFELFPIGTDKGAPPVPEGLNEDLTLNSDVLEASRRQRLRTVQKSLRPRRVIAEDHVDERKQKGKPTPRPGVKYERYRTVEDLDGPRGGDGVMRALFEQGAEMVGLTLKDMVYVVFRMDNRLNLWTKAEIRREKERMGEESRIDDQAPDESHTDEEMDDA